MPNVATSPATRRRHRYRPLSRRQSWSMALRAWWLYRVAVLTDDSIRPTVFWVGLTSLAWGLFVLLAGAPTIDSLFHTIYPDAHGFIATTLGAALLWRTRENGLLWFVLSTLLCVWFWALITSIIEVGFNGVSVIYLGIILRTVWLIHRTYPATAKR